jgi:hypothetical protein
MEFNVLLQPLNLLSDESEPKTFSAFDKRLSLASVVCGDENKFLLPPEIEPHVSSPYLSLV